MNNLYMVCDKLEMLVDEIVRKPELNWTDVERLDKILDEIKDVETILAMRQGGGQEQEGYSRGHYVRGHYSNGYSGDGYSGNRSYGYSGNYSGNRYSNGMENDGMYMSNGSYGNYSGYRGSNGSYRGYSRDDAMERSKQHIERLMNETQDENVRSALQGALSRLG